MPSFAIESGSFDDSALEEEARDFQIPDEAKPDLKLTEDEQSTEASPSEFSQAQKDTIRDKVSAESTSETLETALDRFEAVNNEALRDELNGLFDAINSRFHLDKEKTKSEKVAENVKAWLAKIGEHKFEYTLRNEVPPQKRSISLGGLTTFLSGVAVGVAQSTVAKKILFSTTGIKGAAAAAIVGGTIGAIKGGMSAKRSGERAFYSAHGWQAQIDKVDDPIEKLTMIESLLNNPEYAKGFKDKPEGALELLAQYQKIALTVEDEALTRLLKDPNNADAMTRWRALSEMRLYKDRKETEKRAMIIRGVGRGAIRGAVWGLAGYGAFKLLGWMFQGVAAHASTTGEGSETGDTGHNLKPGGTIDHDTGHNAKLTPVVENDTGHNLKPSAPIDHESGHNAKLPHVVEHNDGHNLKPAGPIDHDTGHNVKPVDHGSSYDAKPEPVSDQAPAPHNNLQWRTSPDYAYGRLMIDPTSGQFVDHVAGQAAVYDVGAPTSAEHIANSITHDILNSGNGTDTHAKFEMDPDQQEAFKRSLTEYIKSHSHAVGDQLRIPATELNKALDAANVRVTSDIILDHSGSKYVFPPSATQAAPSSPGSTDSTAPVSPPAPTAPNTSGTPPPAPAGPSVSAPPPPSVVGDPTAPVPGVDQGAPLPVGGAGTSEVPSPEAGEAPASPPPAPASPPSPDANSGMSFAEKSGIAVGAGVVLGTAAWLVNKKTNFIGKEIDKFHERRIDKCKAGLFNITTMINSTHTEDIIEDLAKSARLIRKTSLEEAEQQQIDSLLGEIAETLIKRGDLKEISTDYLHAVTKISISEKGNIYIDLDSGERYSPTSFLNNFDFNYSPPSRVDPAPLDDDDDFYDQDNDDILDEPEEKVSAERRSPLEDLFGDTPQPKLPQPALMDPDGEYGKGLQLPPEPAPAPPAQPTAPNVENLVKQTLGEDSVLFDGNVADAVSQYDSFVVVSKPNGKPAVLFHIMMANNKRTKVKIESINISKNEKYFSGGELTNISVEKLIERYNGEMDIYIKPDSKIDINPEAASNE